MQSIVLTLTAIHRFHKVELSKSYNSILNALYISGKECIPISGIRKQKCKPGWDIYCEESRQSSIFWHKIWCENGRPRIGAIAEIR